MKFHPTKHLYNHKELKSKIKFTSALSDLFYFITKNTRITYSITYGVSYCFQHNRNLLFQSLENDFNKIRF